MPAVAVPVKFFTVMPVDASISFTLDRHPTLVLAKRAALKLSMLNNDAVFVVLTASHYTNTPLSDAEIDPTVIVLP
jgi:hypothetical protein